MLLVQCAVCFCFKSRQTLLIFLLHYHQFMIEQHWRILWACVYDCLCVKAHKLIHTGQKPVFQCELCPTTCGRKTDLKYHVMKLHTSDRPLQCRKCGKAFPDRYTYKVPPATVSRSQFCFVQVCFSVFVAVLFDCMAMCWSYVIVDEVSWLVTYGDSFIIRYICTNEFLLFIIVTLLILFTWDCPF